MILNVSVKLFHKVVTSYLRHPVPRNFNFIGTLFLTHGESLHVFCRIRRDFSQFSFI